MIYFKHEDLPYRTLTATDKKCMIPVILECTPDGRLSTEQTAYLQRAVETARRSELLNDNKSNHHFHEYIKEINKYFDCDSQKAAYHEEKAEYYAYMADLRKAQYNNFIQLLRN